MTEPYDVIAPYYDLIVGDFDADVQLYAEFGRRVDAPVLELAVGSGRVATALAARGLAVHGVDASAEMLARARAKPGGESLHLVRADLCDYRFTERFGLICCAIDSFLHLTEPARQLAALRLAGEHLAPSGRLILDLPTVSAGRWGDWEPGIRPLELVWSGAGPAGTTVQHFTSFTADPATQIRRVTHIFDEVAADGAIRRYTTSYELRFIFPGELPLLVQAAGLRLDALYGGYDLEPFESGRERMIAVIAAR